MQLTYESLILILLRTCYCCVHKVNWRELYCSAVLSSYHWEVLETSVCDLVMIWCFIKDLLLPQENLLRIDFFCFFFPPLLLMFVLQTSVLEVCIQAYKWRPQLLMCVACILLSSYICKKTSFTEVWTKVSHAHFKIKWFR